jgi:hypothetical protein
MELTCEVQAGVRQPKPSRLKAIGRIILETLKFKQNENKKNEPCEYTRQTQQG